MLDLRAALDGGEVLCGPGVFSGHTGIIELAGYLGFDFVFLDTEQSPPSPAGLELERLIQAAEAADITPTVRIADLSPYLVNKALNLGAKAIWIPHIETGDEAARLVQYGKYAPEGDRGAAPIVRSARYGLENFDDYRRRQNAETILIAIVESVDGIKNVEEIANTPGLDMICFGTFDLGVSMGLSQDDFYGGSSAAWVHPDLEAAGKRCIEACRAAGIYASTAAWSLESAERWVAMGYQFMLYGLDYALIGNVMAELKGEVEVIKSRGDR